MIDVTGYTSAFEIALEELIQGKIPFVIKRKFDDDIEDIIKLSNMDLSYTLPTKDILIHKPF